MEFSIEVKGADQLKTTERIEKIINKGTNYTTLELVRALKNRSPVDTGYLKKWFPTQQGKNKYKIQSPAHYVGFVNYGTGVYGPRKTPIKTSKGSFSFVVNGERVFCKSIKGQKGQYFVEKSIEEVDGKTEQLFIRAAAETDGLI